MSWHHHIPAGKRFKQNKSHPENWRASSLVTQNKWNTNVKEGVMKGRSFKAQILEQSASKSSKHHDPSERMAPTAVVGEGAVTLSPPLPPPGLLHSSAGAVGAGAVAGHRAAGPLGCHPGSPSERASPGYPSPQSSSGCVTYTSGFCRNRQTSVTPGCCCMLNQSITMINVAIRSHINGPSIMMLCVKF